MPHWEPIGLPPVTWGETLCWVKECAELAACSFDGYPYCLDHADEELDAWLARSLHPGLADLILVARA